MVAGIAVAEDVKTPSGRVAFDVESAAASNSGTTDLKRAAALDESFDDSTFPPVGWTQVQVNGTSDWNRVTSGSNPTISTHSGAGMARWNAYNIGADKSTRLQSPSFDLTSASVPALHFFMSHDTGYDSNDDRVIAQVSIDGGSTFTDLGTVSRYDVACATACWTEHVFDLSSVAGESDVMIGLLAVSAYGNNFFVDDVTVSEPSPNFDTSVKSAPGVVAGDYDIPYTITIENSGTAAANSATLVDVLPVGTTYVPASVTCSSGTCAYNSGDGQIEWSGVVPVSGSVTVEFAVDTLGVACGSTVVNEVVLDDPALNAGPVMKSASTQIVSILPLLNEGFEDATFPPVGWSQTPLPPNTTKFWDRQSGAGTHPTISPHSGSAMARWNAYSIDAGNAARLELPALDLGGLTSPTLGFWMSHDNAYSDRLETVAVEVSTDGGSVWDPVGDPFMRYDESCASGCWKSHRVDLSAYAGMSDVRIGLVAVSAYGNNVFVDDVTVAEPGYPCPAVILETDGAAGGCPGDLVGYDLTATNQTNVTETFDMTPTSVWPVVSQPANFVLTPGASGPVAVGVEIPWTAAAGDADDATMELSAQVSGLTDSVNLTTFVNVAEVYTDFEPVPDVPDGLKTRDHSVVFLDGKLYKIGGDNGAAQAGTAVYDLMTDTWSTADSMPAARMRIDCVAISGKIYCAGGYTSSAQDSLYIFDPAAAPGAQWSTGTPLPAARYAYSGVALGGKYYVIGGYTTSYQDTMVIYDPVTDTWESGAGVPTMTTARGWASAGVIGGKIYIAGGLTGSSTVTATTEVYDPVAGTWSDVAPISAATWVRGADGVIDDRFLLIVGGADADFTASSYAIAYDAVADRWMGPQQFNPHLIYGAEGDVDAAGDFWVVSGRLFEADTFIYSPYLTRVTGCPACVGVTDADFVVDPVEPIAGSEATYTGSATASGAIDYSWDFDGLGTATGEVVGFTFPAPGVYTVAMTASTCGGTEEDVAVHDVTVVAEADLAIVKSDNVTDATAGLSTAYTITITNAGPSAAVGALVEDVLPAEVIQAQWACTGSGGGSCSASGSGNLSESVDVPVGGSVVFEVLAMIDPGASGSVVNTATVSPATGTVDPNLTDNSSTDTDALRVPLFADGFDLGTMDRWSTVVSP